MALSLATAPSVEPMLKAEAKAYLRVDSANTDEDTLVDSLIIAARQQAETYTGRALITQTWDLVLDRFPSGDRPIDVPLPPLQSVTSITYLDTNGTSQTLSSANYIVDTKNEPGRIALAVGESWPDTQADRINAVTVRFVAGYGAAAAVPEGIKTAMKLLIAHWFENREPVAAGVGFSSTPMPMSVEMLLWQHRILVMS